MFFGTPDVAGPSLQALVEAEGLDVVAAVTNPDRPRGRSRTPVAPPVKVAAQRQGIPVLQPDRGRDLGEDLAAAAPDVCAVVAYGSILPPSVLAVPAHGFVNLHFSLLPRWRGAAPVQHAIRAGDEITGVTTFVLDQGMDTGPVLDMMETPIGPDETAGALLDRLAVIGAPVLVDSVRSLLAGAVPRPQPASGATLAPRITPRDVRLDFAAPAATVAALVRSASPRPGAHTTWAGDRFKVYQATVSDDLPATAAPGTLLAAEDGLVIACGIGAIRATRVQPAGKPVMDARDWANGSQPDLGARFGADGDGVTT